MIAKDRDPSSLQAWLIHKTVLGDTRVRLRFFTREQGMLDCYYRIGRHPKKNLNLQAFTPLWLLIQERHSWFYVKQLENAGLALNLSGSALFSALYMNELMFYSITLQEPDEALFFSYQNALQALENTKELAVIEASLRRFEKTLLTSCGYGLSWSTENNGDEPIDPQGHYEFIVKQGFKKIEQGTPGIVSIPGYHILAIDQDHFSEAPVLKIAKYILRLTIENLLEGRALKSRTLYTHSKWFFGATETNESTECTWST